MSCVGICSCSQFFSTGLTDNTTTISCAPFTLYLWVTSVVTLYLYRQSVSERSSFKAPVLSIPQKLTYLFFNSRAVLVTSLKLPYGSHGFRLSSSSNYITHISWSIFPLDLKTTLHIKNRSHHGSYPPRLTHSSCWVDLSYPMLRLFSKGCLSASGFDWKHISHGSAPIKKKEKN